LWKSSCLKSTKGIGFPLIIFCKNGSHTRTNKHSNSLVSLSPFDSWFFLLFIFNMKQKILGHSSSWELGIGDKWIIQFIPLSSAIYVQSSPSISSCFVNRNAPSIKPSRRHTSLLINELNKEK